MRAPRLATLAASLLLSSCGSPPAPVPPPPPPVPSASEVPPAPAPDPLGPRPEPPMAGTFLPPRPEVYSGTSGITVWLLERHSVPLVSCEMVVPAGAARDPQGKAGLAYVTASMLDEGAGARGAIELARSLDVLGAHLSTDANADASAVSLTVLKHNLDAAFALFGDVVARPRLDAAEFKRVRDLWHNELTQRAKDPDATARVVFRAALFGPDHPYGHPWDGTISSARAIGLEDVRPFYKSIWRPDQATLVCAGDVTRQELDPLLDAAFKSWKAPAGKAPAPLVPAAPKGPWPRLVLVDRPGAAQAVVAALRPGIAASDAVAPALARVNTAIGGSFTSRLNQDLREQRGITYGAQSRFSSSRGVGQVVAWADVVSDKTGEALAAMLADLHQFAAGGLTDDEVARTRSQSRADLVSAFETVEGIAGRLAADAGLGLGPDFEAKASEARDAAQKADLDALARQYFAPEDAVLVVVGPRATVEPMLAKLGLPAPQIRDAEGNLQRP
jgi:zinc protease